MDLKTTIAAIARGVSFVCLATAAMAATAPQEAIARNRTEAGFQAFVQQFRKTAIARGVRGDVYDAAFAGASLNQRVMELDRRQPEFTQPVWEYLKIRLSDNYIGRGRESLDRVRATLERIEQRYGVEKEVVAAIWGIESFYGSRRGSMKVVEALATLAYDGRRRKFGTTQLIAALKILQNGDISADKMLGSWAGAMGHTQFIPTSYQALAVDFGGDGKRDIWSDDPTDALASTANYLKRSGWRKGAPWGFQVQTPPEFHFSRYSEKRLSTKDWDALGVKLSSGGKLPSGYGDAELLVPAGARGPVFLVLSNFRAILKYNNANAYALAVSLLSERIGGRQPRALAWPENERGLSAAERKEIQSTLNKLGFNAGPVDGIVGGGTRKAIRGFQTSHSMIADGFPSLGLLRDLRRALAAKSRPLMRVAAGPASEQDVREIQTLLKGMGHPLAVDGKGGPRTLRAIRRFLDSRGSSLKAEASKEVLAELRRAVRAN